MSTCFGLLTSESPAVRAGLLDRITAAAPAVQAAVVRELLKALDHPMSGLSSRVGAVQGLGATLDPTRPCGEPCKALRAVTLEPDEPVAMAARLALSRRADPQVLAALIVDTREGTEHLRCSVARALAAYLAAGLKAKVVPALVALLDDRASGVRRAAAETLAPWRTDMQVAAALDQAEKAHPEDLHYMLERARLQQAAAHPQTR